MRYQKPELVVVGSAVQSVRGVDKGCNVVDNPNNIATDSAYEADE